MFSVALLLLAVSFATAANVEVSPLNLAVGAAIDRMRSSGFLDSNFEQFFGPPAVSVPDDCEKEFPVLADKDSDLYRVLLAQRVRVGVAQVAIGQPFFDNSGAELTGSEAEAAREAFRLISNHYNVPIEVAFVIVPPVTGDVFFGPLATALETRAVDVTWSRMSQTAERAERVDFACSSFLSSFALVAGKSTYQLDVAAGAPMNNKVSCIAILCTFPLPPGFEFVEASSLQEQIDILNDDGDDIDYAIFAVEQINFIINNPETAGFDCEDCVLTDATGLTESLFAPATRPLTPLPLTPQRVLDNAAAHFAQLAVAMTTAPARTRAALRSEAEAALGRYEAQCETMLSAHQCKEAVRNAFDLHELSDSSSDSSSSS